MKIKTIVQAVAIAGLSTLSTLSERGPLVVAKPNRTVKGKVDSIARESRKILKDRTYTKFRNDTIKLRDDFRDNPNGLVQDMNKSAQKDIPKTQEGTELQMRPLVSKKSVSLYPTLVAVYKDNFVKTKAVIRSSKMFSDRAKNLYVPIEIYGHKNV